jgi:hypothetical protein
MVASVATLEAWVTVGFVVGLIQAANIKVNMPATPRESASFLLIGICF